MEVMVAGMDVMKVVVKGGGRDGSELSKSICIRYCFV